MRILQATIVILFPFLLIGQTTWTEVFFDQFFPTQFLEVGDLNGDGYMEFVTSNTFGALEVGSQMAFARPAFVELSDTLATTSVQLIDWDLDGDLDILANERDGYTMVLVNDGSADFTWTKWSDNIVLDAHIVDLDEDGTSDLLLGVGTGLQWYKRENDEWVFEKDIYFLNFGGAVHRIRVADMDNDGDLDIVTAISNAIDVFTNDGNFNFVPTTLSFSYNFADEMELTDLDDDGDMDVLLYSKDRDQTGRLNNMGGNQFEDVKIDAENGTNVMSLFADFEGDGDVDILFCEGDFFERDPQMYFYYNEGGTFTKSLLSEDYKEVFPGAVADLDDDGDQDLVMFAEYTSGPGFLYLRNDFTTSTDQTSLEEFQISPTITRSFLNVNFQGEYWILNELGVVVKSGTLHGEKRLDVSDLTAGAYFFSAIDKDHQLSSRFIKL